MRPAIGLLGYAHASLMWVLLEFGFIELWYRVQDRRGSSGLVQHYDFLTQGGPGTAWRSWSRRQLGQAGTNHEQLGQRRTDQDQLGQARASLAKQHLFTAVTNHEENVLKSPRSPDRRLSTVEGIPSRPCREGLGSKYDS